MDLRENWETWFLLEEKRRKEDLTEEESRLRYLSSMFVFDHMEDFVVPYSFLMEELKQFMNSIQSKGTWQLQVERVEQENDDYYYQVTFVSKVDNQYLPVVRISSNVRKANMPTLAELKGEKKGDFSINLLRDTKADGVTLANVTRRGKELPVDSDALLDVLWNVIKQYKVLKIQEEQVSLARGMNAAESKQLDLEKEFYANKRRLGELES